MARLRWSCVTLAVAFMAGCAPLRLSNASPTVPPIPDELLFTSHYSDCSFVTCIGFTRLIQSRDGTVGAKSDPEQRVLTRLGPGGQLAEAYFVNPWREYGMEEGII